MNESINLNAGNDVVLKILGNHTYTIYEDAGHAWIKIPLIELITLKLINEITPFSYIRGKFAYLEEDCDLSTFFKAYHEITGKLPKYRTCVSNLSRIRNYASYTADLAVINF